MVITNKKLTSVMPPKKRVNKSSSASSETTTSAPKRRRSMPPTQEVQAEVHVQADEDLLRSSEESNDDLIELAPVENTESATERRLDFLEQSISSIQDSLGALAALVTANQNKTPTTENNVQESGDASATITTVPSIDQSTAPYTTTGVDCPGISSPVISPDPVEATTTRLQPAVHQTTTPSTGEINTEGSMGGIPPIICAGPAAGVSLPNRIKEKIWANKFVEFYDIVYPDIDPQYALALNNSSATNPALTLAARRRRNLTQLEWASAFDEFIAVSVAKRPHELSDLLTYGKFIKKLMRDSKNWSQYDKKFRTDREYKMCAWSSIRVDLLLDINSPVQSQSHSSNFRSQNKSQNEPIPTGYCFSYHKQNERCEAKHCQYKHTCKRCDKRHPMYRSCNSSTYTKPASDSPVTSKP